MELQFVIIFLFTETSMKKFEIYTIDRCHIEEYRTFGIFSKFSIALEMRFQVEKNVIRKSLICTKGDLRSPPQRNRAKSN